MITANARFPSCLRHLWRLRTADCLWDRGRGRGSAGRARPPRLDSGLFGASAPLDPARSLPAEVTRRGLRSARLQTSLCSSLVLWEWKGHGDAVRGLPEEGDAYVIRYRAVLRASIFSLCTEYFSQAFVTELRRKPYGNRMWIFLTLFFTLHHW